MNPFATFAVEAMFLFHCQQAMENRSYTLFYHMFLSISQVSYCFSFMKLCLCVYITGKSGYIVLCIPPLTAIMIQQKKKTEFVGEAQVEKSAKE